MLRDKNKYFDESNFIYSDWRSYIKSLKLFVFLNFFKQDIQDLYRNHYGTKPSERKTRNKNNDPVSSNNKCLIDKTRFYASIPIH